MKESTNKERNNNQCRKDEQRGELYRLCISRTVLRGLHSSGANHDEAIHWISSVSLLKRLWEWIIVEVLVGKNPIQPVSLLQESWVSFEDFLHVQKMYWIRVRTAFALDFTTFGNVGTRKAENVLPRMYLRVILFLSLNSLSSPFVKVAKRILRVDLYLKLRPQRNAASFRRNALSGFQICENLSMKRI